MRILAATLLIAAAVPALPAAVVATPAPYAVGGVACDGILVRDDAWTGPRPGVLVTHDWMGSSARIQALAERVVALGYVAFLPDVYGSGVRPKDAAEAGATAGIYKKDRSLMRARMQGALDRFVATGAVDPARIAVMGYCFGGTCALELARSGAPVQAAISFHGALETPKPADAARIAGSVLVLHGADDPYVPDAEVAGFIAEMRAARVDWQMISYGNAVHGFTHAGAGTDPKGGYAYEPNADRRSWQAMSAFLAEKLAPR